MPALQGPDRAADVAEAASFFLAVLAYLWLLAIPAPWAVVALVAAVLVSWRRRRLDAEALGLSRRHFLACWRSWAPIWIFTGALFLILGDRRLLHLRALADGARYFAWSAVQQVVYQSMTYLPLRESLKNRRLAAALAGVAFALVHAPNPVLIPATLVWGAASCLLFERRPSVWGLALMQTLLSSMLLWLAPAEWSRSFRIGPFYFTKAGGRGGGGALPPLAPGPIQR